MRQCSKISLEGIWTNKVCGRKEKTGIPAGAWVLIQYLKALQCPTTESDVRSIENSLVKRLIQGSQAHKLLAGDFTHAIESLDRLLYEHSSHVFAHAVAQIVDPARGQYEIHEADHAYCPDLRSDVAALVHRIIIQASFEDRKDVVPINVRSLQMPSANLSERAQCILLCFYAFVWWSALQSLPFVHCVESYESRISMSSFDCSCLLTKMGQLGSTRTEGLVNFVSRSMVMSRSC